MYNLHKQLSNSLSFINYHEFDNCSCKGYMIDNETL